MRRCMLFVVVWVACSGVKEVGSQPSWRARGRVAPVTFAPAGPAAVRYNEPVEAPPQTPLGDAVVAAVHEAATRAGTPLPVADARLFRACAELAELVPDGDTATYRLIEFVLHRHGIIEPSPVLSLMWGNVESTQGIVELLRPDLARSLGNGATARVGIGVARRRPDGTGVVVFALQGSAVAIKPIPRALPAGGKLVLDAVVDARYRDPEVYVTHQDGTTGKLAIQPSKVAGGFTARVTCGKRAGREQVEITASDALGATVLANFPVWCGREPPSSLTMDPGELDTSITDPAQAERRLFALINRDRKAARLPALRWDDRLAEVSRRYSDEMRRTKVVAHRSPSSGSAADRVRAGGIRAAVVLENVARAYGLGEAHAGLLNSPGHRANLMSKLATHVGIGVISDDSSGRRELLITQVFTGPPPKIDPTRATSVVLARIKKLRKVGHDARLSKIAQQYARELAAGKTSDQASPAAAHQINGLSYTQVGTMIAAAVELDAIDAGSLLDRKKVDNIGIGVAQGVHPELGDNAIWVVVLLGESAPPEHRGH